MKALVFCLLLSGASFSQTSRTESGRIPKSGEWQTIARAPDGTVAQFQDFRYKPTFEGRREIEVWIKTIAGRAVNRVIRTRRKSIKFTYQLELYTFYCEDRRYSAEAMTLYNASGEVAYNLDSDSHPRVSIDNPYLRSPELKGCCSTSLNSFPLLRQSDVET